MKNRMAIVAILIGLIMCSGIVPASAYSSSITIAGGIQTIINDVIHIEDSEDVQNILERPGAIEAVNGDVHEYNTYPLPSGESGHPATVITANDNPSADSDIVDRGESFNLNITVPKGVYFKLKVEMIFPTGSGQLSITSDYLDGEIAYNKAVDGQKKTIVWFVGANGDNVAKSNNFGNVDWVCNNESATIFHIEGHRDTAMGQPGKLKVTMIMKETVDMVYFVDLV